MLPACKMRPHWTELVFGLALLWVGCSNLASSCTAALGTALVAIFGGGRGAWIGAAAGDAVGAGGTLGSQGKATAVKSEAVLMFRMRAPASVPVLGKKEAQP